MKHLVALLLVAMGHSHAQQLSSDTHTIYCGEGKQIFNTLINTFKEAPVWKGVEKDPEATVILWMNKQLNSYTITYTTKDKTCIMSVGEAPDSV